MSSAAPWPLLLNLPLPGNTHTHGCSIPTSTDESEVAKEMLQSAPYRGFDHPDEETDVSPPHIRGDAYLAFSH